jgi:hypothetical protein
MIVHLGATVLAAERREPAPPGGVEVGVAWKAIIELSWSVMTHRAAL